MKAEQILTELKEEFPKCWFKPGVDFDGESARAVWSGEGSYLYDGDEMARAFDYYAFEFDPHELIYTMGVHNHLNEFVEARGYYWECYDPGTFMLYKDEA